jgi:hypothetical protein
VTTVEAYFHSRLEAQMAARELAVYRCSEPVPVIPWHSRSWLLEITIPSDHPTPVVMSTVLRIVWGYDGEVHQQPPAPGESHA